MNPVDAAAKHTPPSVARRVKGLSDKTIAWLFVGPTIFLLLAINIFPLIWTIYLSFTNYKANRPNRASHGSLFNMDHSTAGTHRFYPCLVNQSEVQRQ